MKSRKSIIKNIFERHGEDAIYVTPTGYISRAVWEIIGDKNNIFYMNGSMGLSPAIGLGISLNTDRDVIVLSGDASLLMHLGITHTIRDYSKDNYYLYILDNNSHESVGNHECSHLEDSYPGVTEIIKINCEGKTPRVTISFEKNAKQIRNFLSENE